MDVYAEFDKAFDHVLAKITSVLAVPAPLTPSDVVEIGKIAESLIGLISDAEAVANSGEPS